MTVSADMHSVPHCRYAPMADHVLYVIRLLCFGRFLVGLGIGISAVVVPVYLGEVAPAQVTLQPTARTAMHEYMQYAC